MKLLIFLLLTFTIYPQNLLLMGDDVSYEAETLEYIARVQADGGSIVDIASIDNAILDAKTNGYWDSVKVWVGCDYGIKKDANNKLTKLYSLKGTVDLVQADTSKTGTWVASGGQNNKPYYSVSNALNTSFMRAATSVTLSSVFLVTDPTDATAANQSYESFLGGVGSRVMIRAAQDSSLLVSGNELFLVFEMEGNLRVNNVDTANFTNNATQIFDIYGDPRAYQAEINHDDTGSQYATQKFSELLLLNILTKQSEIRTFLNNKYAIY